MWTPIQIPSPAKANEPHEELMKKMHSSQISALNLTSPDSALSFCKILTIIISTFPIKVSNEYEIWKQSLELSDLIAETPLVSL